MSKAGSTTSLKLNARVPDNFIRDRKYSANNATCQAIADRLAAEKLASKLQTILSRLDPTITTFVSKLNTIFANKRGNEADNTAADAAAANETSMLESGLASGALEKEVDEATIKYNLEHWMPTRQRWQIAQPNRSRVVRGSRGCEGRGIDCC
jgi:hypothetical protein